MGAASLAPWLAALRERAAAAPLRARWPLLAGGAVIGSVEAGFLDQIGQMSAPSGHCLLLKTEHSGSPAWAVQGDVTAALNALALALRDAGLAGAWRDEQLAVTDDRGRRLATVERAAVRPLGIATHAVHLVGHSPDGSVWVQQRAWDKANDPGLWDTLVGGMVPAADGLAEALARETWEEAGLVVDDLHGLALGGQLTIRRPSADSNGAGYMVERIDWFHATVPAHLAPVNQDGEVAQFALLEREVLGPQLAQGAFTLEAALILADALGVA